MAQSSVLAVGTSAAASSDIVVADNSSVIVGIFGVSGTFLPRDISFSVVMVTPDAPIPVAQLHLFNQSIKLSGPGTFRVNRPEYNGNGFGIFVNTIGAEAPE